jgi:signal transduction histidine kinase
MPGGLPDAQLTAHAWPDLPAAEALLALGALVRGLREAGDLPSLGEALWWQGRQLGEQGAEAAAMAALQESHDIARRLGDPLLYGQAWMAQAWVDADFGHHARALTTCRLVADWARARGDAACVRQALFATATSLGHLGEHDLAVETFDEARMMLRASPEALNESDRRVATGRYATGQAQAWLMRGGLLLEAGGREAASEAFARSRTLSEQACESLLGASPRFAQPALFGLVRVMLEAGDVLGARAWVRRVSEAAPTLPAPGSLGLAHSRLSESMIELRAGDSDPRRVLERLADLDSVPHPRVTAGDLCLARLRCLFEAHEQAGQYEEALACQRRWSEAKRRLRTRLAREHGLWSDDMLAQLRAEAGEVVTRALREPLKRAVASLAQAPCPPQTSDAWTAIRRAEHSVRRAIDIADQYLGVMRAERMKQEDLELLDLSVLVDDVCEEMAVPPDSLVRLQCRVVREVHIRGDQVLLMRALGNLLSNAFKHAPQHSDVVVELARLRQGAVLSVADQGPGLPLEMRARLFQRFATGAVRRGNGLGLAMVARAARVHGARIAVDCEPGQGTKVSLFLEVAHDGD